MAKTTRSFRYEKRSTDDMKERANMRGGDFDSIIKSEFKLYKIRDGKNLIRIMPPTWEKPKHYGYDIWVNYGIGVDNQSYLSLSKMKGLPDPIAEARREADGDDDEKLSRALQPRRRILSWVIDRQDEDEGPQLFSAPFTLDKSIANLCFDPDTKEVIYLDDPEEGCDLRFYREGEGLKTKYPGEKMKLLQSSPLCEDEKLQAQWLDFIGEHPVPDCLQFYDYDHIAQTFDGRVRKDDEDEDKPRRGTRAEPEDEEPKARTGRAVEPEEEPPFDDDPPPRRARRAVSNGEDEAPKRAREVVEEEENEPGRGSIRDRLRQRRGAAKSPAAEDD